MQNHNRLTGIRSRSISHTGERVAQEGNMERVDDEDTENEAEVTLD